MSTTRNVPEIGSFLSVRVVKVKIGKDGRVYVTVSHLSAVNNPTFVWGRREVKDAK